MMSSNREAPVAFGEKKQIENFNKSDGGKQQLQFSFKYDTMLALEVQSQLQSIFRYNEGIINVFPQ